jgi:hypothetical protein
MKIIAIGLLAMLLSGCLAVTRDPIVVTQQEFEATNARAECKRLARTLVQISRCDNR